MDKKIGAFLDRGAGGFELGGMNGHAQFQPVAFFNDCVNNRAEDRGAFDIGLAAGR